jgi:hypothetical protein
MIAPELGPRRIGYGHARIALWRQLPRTHRRMLGL